MLLVAGCAKSIHPTEFRTAVKSYYIARKLPYLDIAALSVVPAGEVFSGFVLVSHALPVLIAGAVALPLLAAFTGAVFLNVRHGVVSACGCGVGRSATGSPLVVRNLVAMSALSVGLLVAPSAALPSRTSSVVLVNLLSALMALLLIYAPALGEEFRHQLGHVR